MKTALVLVALLLSTGAAVRLAAALALAQAETALKDAPATAGGDRRDLVDTALAEARLAVTLRPRHATAHLALGSALAARADLPGAAAEMERSLALEERAETLLDLGRLAVARGRRGGGAAVLRSRRLGVSPARRRDPAGGRPRRRRRRDEAPRGRARHRRRTPAPAPPLRPR